MYRKAVVMLWLCAEIDACHRGIAHTERTDHLLLVRFPRNAHCSFWHHRNNRVHWFVIVCMERQFAVGIGYVMVYWQLVIGLSVGVVCWDRGIWENWRWRSRKLASALLRKHCSLIGSAVVFVRRPLWWSRGTQRLLLWFYLSGFVVCALFRTGFSCCLWRHWLCMRLLWRCGSSSTSFKILKTAFQLLAWKSVY